MRVAIALLLCFLGAAAAQQWTVLNFTQSVIGTVAVNGAGDVYIGGGDNGIGANVLRSVDGGNTFNMVNVASGEGFFMGSAFGSNTNGIVTGLAIGGGADQFTTDGVNFNRSTEVPAIYLETCQAANAGAEEGSFAVIGNIGSANGVAYSTDNGATFTAYGIPNTTNSNPARYGSFPSASTWYVSAGSFPNSNSSAASIKHKMPFHLTQHVSIEVKGRLAPRVARRPAHSHPHRKLDGSGFTGAILKTDDAGQTWSTQFSTSEFYFNAISCASETVCFAVGEDDNNGYAYATTDGTNWSLIKTFESSSLLAVVALSETEVWIGGGEYASMGFNGLHAISKDGGKTWTNNIVDGVYFNQFAVVDSTLAYATAFNDLQQSNVLKFSN